MMFLLFNIESPTIILLVVVAAFFLFGASKLPQLAKSLGQSRKAFREGMREAEEDEPTITQKLNSNSAAPQITQMSDEELLEEMRKRVATKQA